MLGGVLGGVVTGCGGPWLVYHLEIESSQLGDVPAHPVGGVVQGT